MDDSKTAGPRRDCHELLYRGLFRAGRDYVFPCDPHGHVDIDALGEQGRLDYLFARAMVGRELSAPVTRILD